MFGTTEHRQPSAARAEAALQRASVWLQPTDGPVTRGLVTRGLVTRGLVTRGLVSDGPGTISPGWPTEPDDTLRPPRPAVLEVGT